MVFENFIYIYLFIYLYIYLPICLSNYLIYYSYMSNKIISHCHIAYRSL